ncbi:unnamed protein product [Pieris macdunnoughi]|uniref:Uncharacterized protein n=1 Tax=Pieris macdunnoughi TaxID=345717 RepID=A0A821XWZ0_9NEOP|nr:unnamed protein product [Pieris macdunnoughi]
MLRWRRWRVAAALAFVLAAFGVRVPLDAQLDAHFPDVTPRSLAHFLSDFTNYPRLYRHIGAWRLEREASNYTTWTYAVRYECGPRCEGDVELSAHDERAPLVHSLVLKDERCTRLPLLPLRWCVALEVRSEVAAGGTRGGALLRERARVWCGAFHVLIGEACAPSALRESHLRALRTLTSFTII